VRDLVKILAGGLVAFMVLAIADEWDFFAEAWFGAGEAAVEVAPEERQAATEALYLTLSLMRHLYASGGDPRFAERMPAAAPVVEEMLSDIAFSRHSHRRQEPVLVELEVTAAEWLAPDRMELATRERWRLRTLWIVGDEDALPPRDEEAHCRYLLAREGGAWRVVDWRLGERAAGAGSGREGSDGAG
jgi:hypothetical protein